MSIASMHDAPRGRRFGSREAWQTLAKRTLRDSWKSGRRLSARLALLVAAVHAQVSRGRPPP